MFKQENSTQEYKCIQSIGEYINAIQEIIKKEREKDSDFDKKYEVYFRGHIDKDFFLIPSLLRNKPGNKDLVGQACKEIVDNEHIAFRSLVAKHPSEFAEFTSAIEYLVKMQHYKLKTRLLDITSNALVALYFACTTESGDVNEKLGEVIIFKLPKRIIKHYDSDTISAVANIARCKPTDFIFSLRGEKNQLSDFINGLIDPSCKRNKPTYNNYQSVLSSNSNDSNSTKKQGNTSYNSHGILKKDSLAWTPPRGIPQTEIQNLTNFYRAKIQEEDTSEETFVSDEHKASFDEQLYDLHHQIKSDFVNGLINLGCKRNKSTCNNCQSALLSKIMIQIAQKKQVKISHNSHKISKTNSSARTPPRGIPQTEIQNLINFYRAKIQEVDTSEETYVSNEYKAWFNNNKLCYLHHQIKAEKPYYNQLIEPYDLGKIWAVNTKLENPRIINQSGSFLLFGLGINKEEIDGSNQLTYTKEFYPQIPDAWIAGRIGIGTHCNNIKDNKKNIVQQLSMLGIDHSFIFPDLETAAKEINKQLLTSEG